MWAGDVVCACHMGRTHTVRSISNMRANLANEGDARGSMELGAKGISLLLSHPTSGIFVVINYELCQG